MGASTVQIPAIDHVGQQQAGQDGDHPVSPAVNSVLGRLRGQGGSYIAGVRTGSPPTKSGEGVLKPRDRQGPGTTPDLEAGGDSIPDVDETRSPPGSPSPPAAHGGFMGAAISMLADPEVIRPVNMIRGALASLLLIDQTAYRGWHSILSI